MSQNNNSNPHEKIRHWSWPAATSMCVKVATTATRR